MNKSHVYGGSKIATVLRNFKYIEDKILVVNIVVPSLYQTDFDDFFEIHSSHRSAIYDALQVVKYHTSNITFVTSACFMTSQFVLGTKWIFGVPVTWCDSAHNEEDLARGSWYTENVCL